MRGYFLDLESESQFQVSHHEAVGRFMGQSERYLMSVGKVAYSGAQAPSSRISEPFLHMYVCVCCTCMGVPMSMCVWSCA